MIATSELRIGNWVYCETLMDYARVTQLHELYVVVETHGGTVNTTNIQPIAITCELLDKMGFEKLGLNQVYTKTLLADQSSTLKIHVEVGEEDGWLEACGFYGDQEAPRLPIKSLHQLQNLIFALTGTELEIKL